MGSRQTGKPDQTEGSRRKPPKKKFTPTRLRIVAGDMGGRKIEYNGDPATRPMKERTREAVFSLLGGKLENTFAIDLFGGTGILAFESVSRGSEAALVLELSRGCVSTIIRNAQLLAIDGVVDIQNVDTLRWLRGFERMVPQWPQLPWVVFCCPPYQLWVNQGDRICEGLKDMYEVCPTGSQFICETDRNFDLAQALPDFNWDIREYEPAFIGVLRK